MVKWLRPTYLPCYPLGDNHSRITECEKHRELSRTAAVEGSVLLKNDCATLPLAKGTKVAVFGKAQIDYVKGGGGSGGVHVSYVRNIYDGLKLKKEKVDVFDELSLYYQNYVECKYKEGATLGMFDEAPVPEELLAKAKAYTDTAIITICRYSCENEDRKNDGTDNYFYLSEAENEMVSTVTENFKKVIVLLNVGAMIDTSWFAYNNRISSAIMLWQGGMEGGLAAADMLVGDANPSGKLVDTCAKSFEDYPSSAGFHESEKYVQYDEDIFVGYRYFETIPGKKDCVVYPFGYGLSYTTFTYSNVFAFNNFENIFITLKVTNTGKYAGKEVVQVYSQAPKGTIAKPTRELRAFAKTKQLAPGESQDLCITFTINDMASFDDIGAIAKSSYVMEKGTYKLFLGSNVRVAKEMDFSYDLDADVITEKLHSYGAPENLRRRMLSDGSYLELECKSVERTAFPCEYQIGQKPEEEHKLIDVYEGKISLDTFIAQLTDAELCHLVGGQPPTGLSDTCGMGNLPRLGIPNVMTIDGPAGVRLRRLSGIKSTAFPVATALAASWNVELLEEIGRAGALETKENNLSIWLTPALNIHRSPLCGRNFEYYSEDPLVSGKMAAAMVHGIQSQNIIAVPKHFACNNKETNRFWSDSIVSERALREIYLKGFEICVKEAHPKMIMTSYNIINGVAASENAELIQGILRDEWGFDGMLTSDWENGKPHVQEVIAGNDIKMDKGEPDKLMDALKDGSLKREELAVCVKRILEMILWAE